MLLRGNTTQAKLVLEKLCADAHYPFLQVPPLANPLDLEFEFPN